LKNCLFTLVFAMKRFEPEPEGVEAKTVTSTV